MIKKLLIVLLIVLSSLGFYFFYLKPANEKQLVLCIDNVLEQLQIDGIQLDNKNHGTLHVFKGSTNKKNKTTFIKHIKKQCQMTEFKDAIKVVTIKVLTYPSLNFQVDHFNQIVSVNGLVKTKIEHDNILSNFTNAYSNKYKDSDWQVAHDIKIDRYIESTDFDIYIALLLPSITEIKLTDITIENKKLMLVGLIRNKATENTVIAKLTSLFEEDLQIINQLELITRDNPKIESLRMEFSPMPKLEEFKSINN